MSLIHFNERRIKRGTFVNITRRALPFTKQTVTVSILTDGLCSVMNYKCKRNLPYRSMGYLVQGFGRAAHAVLRIVVRCCMMVDISREAGKGLSEG